MRLPLRPLVRFIYMYFFLGGIWDGRAGFTWCMLQAFYEYLITLKVWELQHGCTTDTALAAGSAVSHGATGQVCVGRRA